MPDYKIDFQEVARTADIATVVTLLDIKITKRLGAQWRGQCPICQAPREFSINADKKKWTCHQCKRHGDAIELVKEARGLTRYDAARLLAGDTAQTVYSSRDHSAPNSAREPARAPRGQGFDAAAYLARLDPAHVNLEPLGISESVLREMKAGYCASGVLAGRLALPLEDAAGDVKGYFGLALADDQQPALKFPTNCDPQAFVFNACRMGEGSEARLVRDVPDVLRSCEVEEPAICFLTELIEPQQHELLAVVQHDRKFRVFL